MGLGAPKVVLPPRLTGAEGCENGKACSHFTTWSVPSDNSRALKTNLPLLVVATRSAKNMRVRDRKDTVPLQRRELPTDNRKPPVAGLLVAEARRTTAQGPLQGLSQGLGFNLAENGEQW